MSKNVGPVVENDYLLNDSNLNAILIKNLLNMVPKERDMEDENDYFDFHLESIRNMEREVPDPEILVLSVKKKYD